MSDIINSFPGYEYIPKGAVDKDAHNMFRGEDVGFGGYVYAEPGMYEKVKTLDAVSMHPSSIIALQYFGEYTQQFEDILNARVAIKHKDFDSASKMFGGKLKPYLDNPNDSKALSNALKLAINSCYGLTSAKFDNPMRHVDNENNIVALRGALFMITMRDELEKMGYKIFHIKTDSAKIVNPDDRALEFVRDFASKYGYKFEVEHSFEKICLVNKSTYIAKLAKDDPEDPGKWTATGDQFQVPYVFKTLFSHEKVDLNDLSEVKSVKTALYLDMNEGLPQGTHNYVFVGRVGQFTPVKEGTGGGELVRLSGYDSNGSATYAYAEGCKGWRWKETEIIKSLKLEDQINMDYWNKKVDDAIATISEYGDFEKFVADDEEFTAMNKPVEE